jgi:S1-C subfamily serine protease
MRVKQIASLTLAVILTFVAYCEWSLASDSVLQAMSEEFTRIVDDVIPAIVEITATERNPAWQFDWARENVGTGIIFDERGYIVTTESVVGKADRVMVTLADGRILKAEVVGADRETDVALIRIDAKNLPTVPLGDSDGIRAGSLVLTMGRSYGSSPTLSYGLVGGIEPLPGGPAYYDAVKINAFVSPGNSGGGVIDMYGKVVGIITAALAEPRAIDFELSFDPGLSDVELRSALNRAKSGEKLAQAKLYAAKSELDIQRARYEAGQSLPSDVQQARLSYVSAQSEYENILTDLEGLVSQFEVSVPHGRETGTLKKEISETRAQLERIWEDEHSLGNIKKILGKKGHLGNLNVLLRKLQGEEVRIREVARTAPQTPRGRFLGRQEESFAIPVTFAKQIIDDLMEDGKVERGWLGVFIRPVTYPDMALFGLDTMEGVIVAKVTLKSPADKAGIRTDDVIINFNDEKVRKRTDLVRMVTATKPYTDAKLNIVRDKKRQVLKVTIGKMPSR